MRGVSILALLVSAVTLAGCAGGGSDAGTLAGNLDVCGLTCPDGGGGGGGTDPDPEPDGDGDGTPDDDDDDGNTGSGAGGNGTSLSTGNTTITLQEGKQNKPTGGKGLSTLAVVSGATLATTSDAILSANKPTTLRMSVDTNTQTNSDWAEPVYMDEYVAGTRETSWLTLGHYRTGVTIRNAAGTAVGQWDAADGRYENMSGVALSAAFFQTPIYAAQIMDSRANGGAGTGYREYRVLSAADNRDEVLQVWAWDDAYAIQYRNEIGGGQAKHQAWAFGGNATAAMPLGGTATYNGRFVGTAYTENWVKPQGAEVDPNGIWQVQGQSQIKANFGTARVTGTIAPESWTSFQSGKDGWYTWTNSKATGQSVPTVSDPAYDAATDPNYAQIYDSVVSVNATITGSTYAGTASLGGDFVTGDSVVHGGFYGVGASETAGVFAVDGVSPDPYGGSIGHEDPRRGYLNLNGAFHGDCQVTVPASTCTP